MIDCIINKNISLNGIGVYMPTRPFIPSNEKEIELIPIPGRDGDLTVFRGWKDRVLNLKFNFYEYDNLPKKVREIRNILLNTKTLMFSEDLEVYYKVKSISISDIQRELTMLGFFSVDFLIEPFDYSTEEDIIELSTSNVINNIGTHYSKPRITLYGYGNLQININSQSFQVNNITNNVVIDTELLECYEVSTNKEFIGDFPVFEVGENEIIKTSNITKIEIEPRWRYI